MNESLLSSVHPVFQLQTTKIYVNEVVQKVNTHGSLQERIFIVSNSGLFLLQGKTFPKATVVSRLIPFSQLVLMIVDEKTMQFYCGGVTMVLQHPKHVEIAAIVYSIKNALFGEKPRPPKFEISPNLQERFDSSHFVFESASLRGDRFISLCLQIPAKKLQPERMVEFREKLINLKDSVKITASLVASPFFEAFTTTIALDPIIQDITFSDVSMCSIFNSVLEVIDFSTSAATVSFNNVGFVGQSQYYVPVTKLHIGTLHLHFQKCDLTTALFNSFLDTLSRIGCLVKTLDFDHCSFSQVSFDYLITTLLNSQAFKTIEELSFIALSSLGQTVQVSLLKLFGSDIVKDKCLKSLTASSCSLHIDQMIPGIFNIDNAIEVMNFS